VVIEAFTTGRLAALIASSTRPEGCARTEEEQYVLELLRGVRSHAALGGMFFAWRFSMRTLDKTGSAESERPLIPHSEPAGGTGTLEAALARETNPVKRFLKVLAPGLVAGASDDDPSGIGTYAVAGASLGYSTLWTALITFPLMAAIQSICAKVGMVTGTALAGALPRHYPRPLLYGAVLVLFVANTINAGADIGAVAAGVNMIAPIPIIWMIVPVAAIILVLQLFGSYRLIANIFRWLAVALFAYIGSSLFARPDPGEVLRATFIPTVSLDSTFLATLVAIVGTTISPYLFFWQCSQEVEEEEEEEEEVQTGRIQVWQRRGASDAELKFAAWDVNTGMFFSNVVMYFIILGTAATLHNAGQTSIQSAADAAKALRPLAGDAAGILLVLGLIGAGFLTVPILTGSAAYALSEAFAWRLGLNQNPARAKQFYAVIIVATLVGTLINFLGINPIDALFWTAVINGFIAPPLMLLIRLISNNRAIMQDRVNGTGINILGWAGTVAMFAAAIALVVTWGQS
jgi:NRAMP (natural resistance-associated macrophage protein)-like metal ion transporter